MQKSSVTMLMTEVAHCKFGLFSLLQCGNKAWYTHENRLDLLTPNAGCIPGGEYTVLTMELDNDERYWILSDVPDRSGITFSHYDVSILPSGPISVGEDIGCENGRWSVIGRYNAHLQLSQTLEEVSSFKLYIKRLSVPMKSSFKATLNPLTD